MSKRNPGLKRKERDDYATPFKAVLPVIPFLMKEKGLMRFAEPCCGIGQLITHLTRSGFECTFRNDISNGRDALDWDNVSDVDFIITNPPYERKLMHSLIEHFVMTKKPVWLLLEADWLHTKQAVPYLRWATHIVSIGRVRWMHGTTMDGYDNSVWIRFHHKNTKPPQFFPRHINDDKKADRNVKSARELHVQ